MSSLEPRRFKLTLVLAGSAWACCLLGFGIVIVSSLDSAHLDVVQVLTAATLVSALSALFIGLPLGFVAYAVLEFRRQWLRRSWRNQSGLTNRFN